MSVQGALHLKSACSYLGDDALLANLDWIDPAPFREMEIVPVEASEAWGARPAWSTTFSGSDPRPQCSAT